VWNVVGFGLLLWLERRLRGWRRTGDIALFYAIWYGIGRFWIEGLRTDSLCTNGIGGECGGALRTAQVVSLLLVLGGLIGLYINHRRALPPSAIEKQPKDEPERAAGEPEQMPEAASATAGEPEQMPEAASATPIDAAEANAGKPPEASPQVGS
jgi:hypothetical protein